MAVIRSTRFEVTAGDVEEMVTRRNALVDAVRRTCSGLTEARLARVDDRTWLDEWRWDSAASMQAALEAAGSGRFPELAPARALTRGSNVEVAEVVDER